MSNKFSTLKLTKVDLIHSSPLKTELDLMHYAIPSSFSHYLLISLYVIVKTKKERAQCMRSNSLCGKHMDTGSANSGPMHQLAADIRSTTRISKFHSHLTTKNGTKAWLVSQKTCTFSCSYPKVLLHIFIRTHTYTKLIKTLFTTKPHNHILLGPPISGPE